MNSQQVFTVEQVAARYNVSVRTIHRWIKAGLFPGAKKQNPLSARRSPYLIPQSALNHYEKLLADAEH